MTRVRRLALALVPVIGVVACGSGGSGPGHDSPEAAVRGVVAALQSGDIGTACDWVAPSQRGGCTQNLAAARAFGPNVSFRVDNFAVKSTETDPSNPDKATVHVDAAFHICVSGQCVNSSSLLAAQPGADGIPTVREQGQWWVANLGGDVGAGAPPPSSQASPGAGGSDTTGVTTDTGTSAPAPSDTGGAAASPGAAGASASP